VPVCRAPGRVESFATETLSWSRSRFAKRMVARGTDSRSGEEVSINVTDVSRFSGGRMIEHSGTPDRFALLHQMLAPSS
jgi:hypothetical protein